MILQLNLFTPTEPEWENITTEWLLEYLRSNYPDANFELNTINDWDEEYVEIRSTTLSKRAEVNFSICKDADLAIWENPVIVMLNVGQKYGNYCTMGHAVNSMERLKEDIDHYIKNWRDDITVNYQKFKNKRKYDEANL